MIRLQIRRELPPEAFKPRPLRAFTALAIVATNVTAGVILATSSLPVVVCLLLSVLSGCMYASLFFLGHEAGHGAIVKSRTAQDVLMWAAFSIFLLPPTLWRVWHNKVHHIYTNHKDYDPDNFGTLSSYNELRSVRVVEALTPGSGRWLGLIYLPLWFTIHTQVVLWVQSRRCRGFESLGRTRASTESLSMTAFWVSLTAQLGLWSSLWLIIIPMMAANVIIMSYIATNHLLRPLLDHSDPLESSMSVTTYRWLDLIHFNFSHHVEHHLFPSMSSRFAPLVRVKLRRYAEGRYVAAPHLRALLVVFRTPRIHKEHALVDAASGRSTRFADVDRALVSAAIPATRREVRDEP
jgi:fatty acid desaturase